MRVRKNLHLYSEGQRLLRAVMFASEFRVPGVTIAERCGVAQSTVSRWAIGFAEPSSEAKAVLEERYNIPVVSWAQKPTAGVDDAVGGAGDAA